MWISRLIFTDFSGLLFTDLKEALSFLKKCKVFFTISIRQSNAILLCSKQDREYVLHISYIHAPFKIETRKYFEKNTNVM